MSAEFPHDLLSQYPSLVRPSGEITCLGNAGGLSGATLWRFRAPAGELVCRAWPLDGPDATRLSKVHGWLGLCRTLRFIPVPLETLDGRSFLERRGRLHEVAPWLPGTPDLDEPPSTEHVESALVALASLHAELAGGSRRGSSPGLRIRARELEELNRGGLERIEEASQTLTSNAHMTLVRRWLFLARIQVPRLLPRLHDCTNLEVRLQPCLRDARPDHFLFTGRAITGIVDFGAMDVESVAVDLARLFGEWLPRSSALREHALRAYARVRPLDESELALISAMESAADVLIAGHWITWSMIDRRPITHASTFLQRLEKGVSRLERTVSSAEEGNPGFFGVARS